MNEVESKMNIEDKRHFISRCVDSIKELDLDDFEKLLYKTSANGRARLAEPDYCFCRGKDRLFLIFIFNQDGSFNTITFDTRQEWDKYRNIGYPPNRKGLPYAMTYPCPHNATEEMMLLGKKDFIRDLICEIEEDIVIENSEIE